MAQERKQTKREIAIGIAGVAALGYLLYTLREAFLTDEIFRGIALQHRQVKIELKKLRLLEKQQKMAKNTTI